MSEQGNNGHHHTNSVISKRRKWTSQENKIVMECEDEGEDVRYILPEVGAEKQADSLDEEEVFIVMEITEVIERSRKDKLPSLRNVRKNK